MATAVRVSDDLFTKAKKHPILLAYQVIDATLYLYTFGSHENFYRDLKKYLQH